MKRYDKINNIVGDCVAYASMVFVAWMMVLNVADIFASKIGGSSIQGAYELSEVSLMCAVFLAFAYGQTQKTHVHMTLFIGRLPKRSKYVPFFIGNLCSFGMCLVFAYAFTNQTIRQYTTHTITGILHIPYFPFYVISLIGLYAFCFTLLYDLIVSLLAIFKDDYAEIVSSHW